MTCEEIEIALRGYDIRETVTYPSRRQLFSVYQIRGTNKVQPFGTAGAYISLKLYDPATRHRHAENFPLWDAERLLHGERIEVKPLECSVRRTLELIPIVNAGA
ncbi:MAG: hypothetical protein LUC22_07345 [Prevotella sp.]|nr:hypothetical protein [Prevotella sp.]